MPGSRPDLIRRGRLAVISPHFDDAVFSCGDLLAKYPGTVVITAFGARPRAGAGITPWDAAAGFSKGDDVVGARREEDRQALQVLSAVPVWLDFRDGQYGPSPSPSALARGLDKAVRQADPTAICVPLGLFHSDHRLTHAASLAVVDRHPQLAAFCYEDAIYRRFPGLVRERLAALRRGGRVLRRAGFAPRATGPLKRRAVACYRSQLRALSNPGRPGFADVFATEGYWRLVR